MRCSKRSYIYIYTHTHTKQEIKKKKKKKPKLLAGNAFCVIVLFFVGSEQLLKCDS